MLVSKGTQSRASNIQQSLRGVLIVANIFSLIPISGVIRNTNLRFRCLSAKVLYSLSNILITSFILSVAFYHSITYDTDFPQIVEDIFYVSSIVTSILFLHLARNWPKLITKWSRVDASMAYKYGFLKNLDLRIKLTMIIFLTLATAEYSLSLAHHVHSIKHKNLTLTFQNYYSTVYPQIAETITINHLTGSLIQICSILSTFSWNFNDIFIILLSSILALRFRQVASRLRKHSNNPTLRYWMEMREDYDALCKLCSSLDDCLMYLVLNSFTTNLFFIIVQLFNSLRKITDTVERVYFYFSFAYLIIRSVTVSLYAAWINDESKEPMNILNSVPSSCYNNEVRRFLQQVSSNNAALTGWKMFKVTKGLILNIAGAIVTYELVLIQFSTTHLDSK